MDQINEGDAEERPDSEQHGVAVHVCRRCSTQSETDGDFCPHCGAAFVRGRRRLTKRGKIIAAVVAGLVLAGGVTAGVVAKVQHDNQVAEEQAEAERAEKERLRAEREARAAAEEQEAENKVKREIRQISVRDMRKSITKDARSRVAEGVLDGPIYGTQCDPVGGGSVSNLDAKTTKFECLAINEKNGDGTVSGYQFDATMNWDDGSYTWRLGG